MHKLTSDTVRATLVRLHRWAGLVLAIFLSVAGLTGALLAWNDELEAVLAPELFTARAPSPGMPLLDALLLRERVQSAYPQAFVARAPLDVRAGHALVLRLYSLPNPVTGLTPELANDQVFVNPYTGELQGARKWGDLSQGARNLMPFVLRLHDSLALGKAGAVLMGMIALLWTVDCVVGAIITFPKRSRHPGARPWLARWRPAWTLRWGAGSHKLTFDLHRAGGLWLWAMLFVLAWSSVAFNLRQVYEPVTRTLLAYQPDPVVTRLSRPLLQAHITWHQARDIGRARMAELGRARGFAVFDEYMLIYDPRTALYNYYARTDRDVSERWGLTRVSIDGRTGVVASTWLPTGGAGGDTLRTWITTLHMAAVGGRPMQFFVCLTGVGIAMLSVTGVMLWLRKRKGRRSAQDRRGMGVKQAKMSDP